MPSVLPAAGCSNQLTTAAITEPSLAASVLSLVSNMVINYINQFDVLPTSEVATTSKLLFSVTYSSLRNGPAFAFCYFFVLFLSCPKFLFSAKR